MTYTISPSSKWPHDLFSICLLRHSILSSLKIKLHHLHVIKTFFLLNLFYKSWIFIIYIGSWNGLTCKRRSIPQTPNSKINNESKRDERNKHTTNTKRQTPKRRKRSMSRENHLIIVFFLLENVLLLQHTKNTLECKMGWWTLPSSHFLMK